MISLKKVQDVGLHILEMFQYFAWLVFFKGTKFCFSSSYVVYYAVLSVLWDVGTYDDVNVEGYELTKSREV